MPEVIVNVAPAAYSVIVRRGLLGETGSLLAQRTPLRKIAAVIDSNVADSHWKTLRQSLATAGFDCLETILPAGEEHKTVQHILPAYDRFLSARIERGTPVISLGGGMITDMGGFIAATLLRGLPLVQIPTTLLAMVDASVGGKTGVNHATGKNLIGAFHQPIAVLIDPQTLITLPPRELRNGLAECIKHEIIRDAAGFDRLEQTIDRALALDLDYLQDLVAHNVAIKARVVEADPFEKGERAHLNFGHTFGHAIETISNYSYSHGQCVALGMVAAARLAVDLRLLDAQSCGRIVSVIARGGLPVGGLTLDTAAVVNAMGFDKKVRAGRLRFVLPDRIGHVIVRDDVPIDLVTKSVESLRQ